MIKYKNDKIKLSQKEIDSSYVSGNLISYWDDKIKGMECIHVDQLSAKTKAKIACVGCAWRDRRGEEFTSCDRCENNN
jgi:hypothetical protein